MSASLNEAPKSWTVRVVVLQDEQYWVAQCLEWDLATQGKTLQQLFERLHEMLLSQMVVSRHLGREPFENLPPAPKRFHRLWERSTMRMVPVPEPEADAPRVDVRMASLDLRAA